jgi:phage FluMu protein Com
MINVKCQNCNGLLGEFDSAKGIIKCHRCKTFNNISLTNNKEYNIGQPPTRMKVVSHGATSGR